MRPVWRFLIGQAIVLLVVLALFGTVLGRVPALYKPTAAIFCPSNQPDALVVEYYRDNGRGVGTSHTLLCIGPAGDITEVGSWKPLGLVTAAALAGLEAIVLPLQILGIVRRRRRGGGDAPPKALRRDRRIQLGVGFGG